MGSQLKDGLGQPDDLAIGYNSAMMNPVFRRRRRRILLAAACLILLLPLLLSASGALSPMRGMQQENRQVALTFDDLPVNSTRMEQTRWALTEGKRGSFFAGEPEPPPFVSEASGIGQ